MDFLEECNQTTHHCWFAWGSPCETWSQARERNVRDSPFPPRVLRTAELPWGKESLSLRELRQLSVGNSLMGFQLEAVVGLFSVGGVDVDF